ncbi:MAG TPA: signal peptidase I [Ktedonobacterales bacterium]|nr:signal peptidase I [Ktedonobacterales bacterium]
MRTSTLNRTAAERRAHLMRELVEVLLFVGIVFAAVSVTQSFGTVDSSMAPALQVDQRVLVNKAAYILSGPGRGDVVLVADPQNPSQLLMRRVIAVPGDTILITATTVTVNGVTLDEHAYTGIATGQPESQIIGKYTLAQDQYWVMADARLAASNTDSRGFGAVSRANIVGRAEFVYWPLHDFHWIDGHPDVFSSVPNH